MADSTVAALTAASALDGTELYYGVQGGADRKVTGAQIKALTTKITINAQVGTTYTVQSSDIGGLTTFSNASSIAVTLPQATGSFSNGTTLFFENKGAGLVTITPTTSTIDGAATLVLAKNEGVTLISDGTNYTSLRGVGISIGGSVTGGTAASVPFIASGPVLAQNNANFSWNDSTLTLQIGSTSKASLVGSVTGSYDSSTQGSVRIGGSPGATSFFDLMSNPNGGNSIPVPTFRPVVANKTIALDLCPNGSPTDAGYGKAWFDLCNTDQITSGNAATQTIHMAAHASSFFLGAGEYNTSTILPFNFGTFNGDSPAETVTFTINADASLSIVQPIKLGGADAASPTAQTLSMQSVVTGTLNTAGVDWTINGSKGTGTGAGGNILFFTAPAGGSGTSQNTLTQRMQIGADGVIRIANGSGVNGVLIGGGYNGVAVGNCAVGYHASAVSGQVFEWNTGGLDNSDTYISRTAAAALQMGLADAAAPVAQTFGVQSVVAGTTDTAGTDWTLRNSLGTGTAASGNYIIKTGFSAKSTGSSQHTTVDRDIVVAKGKVLTSAAAFSMFDVALPTLSMCGGVIEATIVCTNGTDMQSFTQTVSYSAINKGGVYTTSITPSTGDKSVSGGSTLTTSWTIVSGTNKVTIKVTPTTSLTPSTNAFLLYYRVKNNSEQATTIL